MPPIFPPPAIRSEFNYPPAATQPAATGIEGMMAITKFVGAQHEFHDAIFVQGWADRFVPSPPRLALFDLILDQIARPGIPNQHVLELGLGPGYMARHILGRNDRVSYEGLDFSTVFFDVARKVVGAAMPRPSSFCRLRLSWLPCEGRAHPRAPRHLRSPVPHRTQVYSRPPSPVSRLNILPYAGAIASRFTRPVDLRLRLRSR